MIMTMTHIHRSILELIRCHAETATETRCNAWISRRSIEAFFLPHLSLTISEALIDLHDAGYLDTRNTSGNPEDRIFQLTAKGWFAVEDREPQAHATVA